MVKFVHHTMMKIVLFFLLMLLFARVVPYDDMVSSFVSRHLSYESVNFIGGIIPGEPDPEPYQSAIFYIDVLINALISLPVFSAVISIRMSFRKDVKLNDVINEWVVSTFRRFLKLFTLIFLFCALFRFLPYQSLLPPDETYSAITTTTILTLNLILTILCYWFITKKVTIKWHW